MSLESLIVHDRTLLGALDSFLKAVVHVRPQVVARYEDALATMTEQWLAQGGDNLVARLDPAWLDQYLQATDDPMLRPALQDFFRWNVQNDLLPEDHRLVGG